MVAAGSLPAACRLAERESFDLVIVEYDFYSGNFIGSVAESAGLFMLPHVIVVADPHTWSAGETGAVPGPPDVVWKPIQPERLLAAVRELVGARAE